MRTKTEARAELIRLYDLMDKLGEDIHSLKRTRAFIRTDSVRLVLTQQIDELRKLRGKLPPLIQELHEECPDFFETSDVV